MLWLGQITAGVKFDPVAMIEKSGFEKLNFGCEDAIVLKDMPFHHKDPFDRILISQSIQEDIPIMTVDKQFEHYEANIILVG